MLRSRKYYFYSMFSRIITLNRFILSLAVLKQSASSRSLRPLWLTAVFTAVVSVLAWGMAIYPIVIAAASQSFPVASAEQTTYDFGEVYEGEHIFHTFTVRNTGSAPLEIRDPAAKAENTTGDQNTRMAVDFESRPGRSRLGGQATVSELSFAAHPQAMAALHPLLAARGRPAAPA